MEQNYLMRPKEKDGIRRVDAKNPIDQDLKRPVIMSPNWNSEKLDKIMFKAYLDYYFRPQIYYAAHKYL